MLTAEHRVKLQAAAITDEVIDASGIMSVKGGIAFPWYDGNGTRLVQFKPDEPAKDDDGRLIKYLFPKDASMILNQLRDSGQGPVLICEGTKQQYAALSHAPEGYAVYGMAGCWCWTDADLMPFMGRDVFVLFDGDVTTNRNVYDAASQFREKLEYSGAARVLFVKTTARGQEGLDDVLAGAPEERRAFLLNLWITKSLVKLPRAPAKAETNPFFEKGSLQVQRATEFLLDNQPAALTAEHKVALYMSGSYHIDGTAFLAAVTEQLGDQFRPNWRAAMEEMAIGSLFSGAKLLPERSPFRMLNVKNGMLDLLTLELKPHDPSYMSCAQVPIEWDEDAKAPVYGAWLEQCCPGQVSDIEEVAGTMLDPTKTPHKAAFLFGPSRSGKSTFLRLLQVVAGIENRSSVTLHDLSRDRFAAANVYGKMLNAAADLSNAHVEDLSVFKMMTGEDAIHGNRKYGAQFTFTNQALFAFSANDPPTVSESSRAYAERIKPFEFPNSFAGREDPTLEAALYEELPGILMRWVEAYRRVLQRGGYSVTDERVRREFDTRSDRVAQWVSDMCVIVEAGPGQVLLATECTGRRESASAFNRWAERNGGSRMGERKIFDRLRHIGGVVDVRVAPLKSRAFNIVIKDNPDADQGVSLIGGAGAGAAVAGMGAPTHTNSQPDVAHSTLMSNLSTHGQDHPFLPPLPPTDSREGATDHGDADRAGVCGASQPEHQPAVPVTGRTQGYGTVQGTHGNPEQRRLGEARQVLCEDLPHGGTGASVPGDLSLATVFDIETCGADELWRRKDFVRLSGVQQADASQLLTTDPDVLIHALSEAQEIAGHNILGFDLLALARHHGADYEALAAKSRDSLIIARQQDPPLSKGMPAGYYKLDPLAQRLGHEGKSDDLKCLAKQYGGYDAIPLDNEQYKDYLCGDLRASRAVLEAQGPLDAYTRREHRVQALMGRISLEGIRIDEELLHDRYQRGADRFALGKDLLVSRYGFPEINAQGKQAAAPQRTGAGKEAFHAALVGAGIGPVWLSENWTLNKDGSLSLAKEVLSQKIVLFADHGKDAAALICETVLEMNGVRSIYGNVLHHLVDGRVHPTISPEQASGRWSVTKPGVTVMGKRGGKHVEREIMLPEAGHVMIAFDFDQVDMRAIAGHCQDPAYMALFAPGRNVHSEVALAVFGTVAKRDDAKVIGHAWNYGASIGRLVAAGATLEDATRFDERMRESYPRLSEWRDEVRGLAGAGEILDNGFGRRMRVHPEWAYTQAPAAMGQGGTRDIVAEGLLNLPAEIVPMLRAVIHDEAVLSVPADSVEDVSRAVLDAFTFEFKGVAITAGASPAGRSWGQCYSSK